MPAGHNNKCKRGIRR